MKPLENVWSGLMQRRLLPVAILLLAALAAIPFVLAKDPEPIATQPTAPAADKASETNAATAEPVVSLVADGERTQRRRVLGVRKNPFEPAKAPKVKAAQAPATAPVQAAGGTGTAPAGGTQVTVDGGQPSAGAPGAPVRPSLLRRPRLPSPSTSCTRSPCASATRSPSRSRCSTCRA